MKCEKNDELKQSSHKLRHFIFTEMRIFYKKLLKL